MIECGPAMIMYRPTITTIRWEMIAFLLEILICKTEINGLVLADNRLRCGNCHFLRAVGNSLIRRGLMITGDNRLHCGNDYLHLGDDYLRSEDDRRCRIDNRVRQGNGSLQHDNDRGRCTNNRSRGGKDRVVDRVDRRGNGNTCFAIVNDCR